MIVQKLKVKCIKVEKNLCYGTEHAHKLNKILIKWNRIYAHQRALMNLFIDCDPESFT
jgi:hypothetical protein